MPRLISSTKKKTAAMSLQRKSPIVTANMVLLTLRGKFSKAGNRNSMIRDKTEISQYEINRNNFVFGPADWERNRIIWKT
jgi:hypothetical protein